MDSVTRQEYKMLFLGLALLGILILIGMAAKYLMWVGFVDHGEVTMTATAWMFIEGKPIYTDLLAAERYSIQHGPMIYLFMGFLMKWLGPSIFTAKLAGFLLIPANLILAWLCFRKLVNDKIAVCLVGLEAWILLKWPFAFLSRDDSIMMFGMILGLCFLHRGQTNKILSVVGFATAMGILIGSKIHSIIYFLPILVMWYLQEGWKKAIVSMIVAAIIGIIPFLISNISLVNYVHWLMLSGHHGFIGKLFLCNLLYLVVLFLIPIGAGLYYGVEWRRIWEENKLVAAACVVSGLIVVAIGAKAGSGNYHLIPFVPLYSYFTARIITYPGQFDKQEKPFLKQRWTSIFLIVIGCIILSGGINSQKRILSIIQKYPSGAEIVGEIHAVEKLYAGKTLEVGFGGDQSYKQYRSFIPVPVLSGNSYLLDGAALMDMQLSDLPLPASTTNALRNGLIQIWLIPAGEEPFSLHSYYRGGSQMVLDESTRSVFLQHYVLVNHMKYFDVWQYNQHDSLISNGTMGKYDQDQYLVIK